MINGLSVPSNIHVCSNYHEQLEHDFHSGNGKALNHKSTYWYLNEMRNFNMETKCKLALANFVTMVTLYKYSYLVLSDLIISHPKFDYFQKTKFSV